MLSKLTQLCMLDIYDSAMKHLSSLHSLQHLSITGFRSGWSPSDTKARSFFAGLSQLRELTLSMRSGDSSGAVPALSKHLSLLQHLEALDLSGQADVQTSALAPLSSLTCLILDRSLQSPPADGTDRLDGLCTLTALQHLSLQGTLNTRLPHTLSKLSMLTGLTYLDLCGCQFSLSNEPASPQTLTPR